MMTQKDVERLEPFEDHLHRAVYSDCLRYPGRAGVALMDEVINASEGVYLNTDSSCGRCVLSLLKRVGKLYFEVKKRALSKRI